MADDSYGSIEAPEPPQESFLSSEPTQVPAPRRKLRYAIYRWLVFRAPTCRRRGREGPCTLGAQRGSSFPSMGRGGEGRG